MNLKKIKNKFAMILCVGLVISMTGCGDKEESYRIVKLVDQDGIVNYTRDEETNDVYNNMNFENGDAVETGTESMAKISLDSDKILRMGAETSIEMQAEGNEEDSRTTIVLHAGEISNEIQNKLSGDSMYEIKTSNATIGVHGTIFYVKATDDETIVYCEEGRVEVTAGEAVAQLEPGEALVVEDDTITEVPLEEILDEVAEEFQEELEKLGEATKELFEEGSEGDDDAEDEASDTGETDIGATDNEDDADLSKVEGEPTGNGYELYCDCGEEIVATIYVPSPFTLKAHGAIQPDEGESYRVVSAIEALDYGLDNANISNNNSVLAKYAFDGEIPDEYTDFEGEVIELLPVNGGQECVLLHYSYYLENWDRTYTWHAIIMRSEDCNGDTAGVTLKIQEREGEIYPAWTTLDYQRMAYETFGR